MGIIMNRIFDRIVHFDEKSRNFPIRTLIGEKPRRSYTWRCDTFLNQGSEGACTGFAVSHEAAARPVVVKGITNETARQIYRRARQLDEWPGENYEGSSVLGAIKAGTEKGWYSEYRWAFGLEDAILALGYYGPGVAGLSWYTGMMKADSNGFIHPTGSIEGGHAILVNGVNVKKEYVRLHNSWGKSFGINGECFLSFDDFGRLLHEQGEFCIPVVRSV
jgi:hypothetical protein